MIFSNFVVSNQHGYLSLVMHNLYTNYVKILQSDVVLIINGYRSKFSHHHTEKRPALSRRTKFSH